MEQAKKRDHKILITDMAIEKVPLVRLPGFPEADNLALWRAHKELLRYAKEENASNEVLMILSLKRNRKVMIRGGEFEVLPDSNPAAVGLAYTAARNELLFLHNHPSTNSFSLADLATFLVQRKIGVLSVVTNQGGLYVVQKMPGFAFDKLNPLLFALGRKVRAGEIEDRVAVRKFLRACADGGVHYEKST